MKILILLLAITLNIQANENQSYIEDCTAELMEKNKDLKTGEYELDEYEATKLCEESING